MKRLLSVVLALVMVLSIPVQASAWWWDTDAKKYEKAITKLSEGNWAEAIQLFEKIPMYKDSAKYTTYGRAMQMAEQGNYDFAIVTMESLGDFVASNFMAIYLQAKRAESLKDYDMAESYYLQIPLFKDSAECLSKIPDKKLELERQNCIKAVLDGNYDVDRLHALTARSYIDPEKSIQAQLYNEACTALEAGNHNAAYYIFSAIPSYKDASNLLATDQRLLDTPAALDATFQPGKYVSFGHYPQTTAGNDNTPIEWLVLARDGMKALLLSRYGLDAKLYNTDQVDITWEQCTLRKWLNNDFLNKAFSSQEQSAIVLTNVDNSKSQGYSSWSTNGGNNTQDKVFLLSYAEANLYLGVTNDDRNNTKSRVEPTAYAIKQDAYTSSSDKTADGKAAGWWWLRSPGWYQSRAASVSRGGSLYYYNVDYGRGSVRPALWVNLESGIF